MFFSTEYYKKVKTEEITTLKLNIYRTVTIYFTVLSACLSKPVYTPH